MKKIDTEQLKIGTRVRGIFRKHGRHLFTGTISEIDDCQNVEGIWFRNYSIRLDGSDLKDHAIQFLLEEKVQILIRCLFDT